MAMRQLEHQYLTGQLRTAFLRQSREMAECWAGNGNPAVCQALDGDDHFSVLKMATDDPGPIVEQALAFLSRPG